MTRKSITEHESKRWFVTIQKTGTREEIEVHDKFQGQKIVFTGQLNDFKEIAQLVQEADQPEN